jgi:hypothetical protein
MTKPQPAGVHYEKEQLEVSDTLGSMDYSFQWSRMVTYLAR